MAIYLRTLYLLGAASQALFFESCEAHGAVISKASTLGFASATIADTSQTPAGQSTLTPSVPAAKKGIRKKSSAAKKAGSATSAKSAGGTYQVNDRPADRPTNIDGESGRLEGDIIVRGLRENVKAARNIKRRAQQIVDVVVAQDIGKLPDKNVTEALARVPGVQIDRARGEGLGVRVRGLDNILTTVNGSQTFSGAGRGTFLNDIPSDLISGIEVYKTRTPDQVEGSQTGVVNLSLRRPTDFAKGLTVALNAKGEYFDQVKRVNPSVNGLIAYNIDTEIGQLGVMMNASWSEVVYNESGRWNGFPERIGDNRQIVDPGTVPTGLFVPKDVGIVYRKGFYRRPAVVGSLQWKPNDDLRFTLEGSARRTHAAWLDDNFNIPISYTFSSAPPPRLTNVAVDADGRRITSLTAKSLDPFGPAKLSWDGQTKEVSGRLQMDYLTERVELTGWVNYFSSSNITNSINHWTRFSENPSFDVEFNTDKDPLGGMNITFTDFDLMDEGNYVNIDGFSQDRQHNTSSEIEARYDLKLNTFSELLDWFKTGFRFAKRDYDYKFGDRAASDLRVPIALLPDYKLTPVGQGFVGSATAANANWLMGDGDAIRNSWDTFRGLAVRQVPSLATYYPAYDPFRQFAGYEATYAAYAMAHYNVKLLFPIDGIIGVRAVNIATQLSAYNRTAIAGTLPTGLPGVVETANFATSRGNSLDFLPSVNAIVHFTDNLQLRAAYTYDVGRPGIGRLNPNLNLDARDIRNPTARGGNANLGPVVTKKYDASLEYYFGRTGSLSVAVWQWEQDGFAVDLARQEDYPGLTVPVRVIRPINAGRGRHRGIEISGTTFFGFLPGILSNLGASGNFTYNRTRQATPLFDADNNVTYIYRRYTWVAPYTFNVAGFFERGGLNARLAYNWTGQRPTSFSITNPYDNQFLAPIERLDASIQYDVTKNITIAAEATNLTRDGDTRYFGSRDFPAHVNYFSRTFSLAVRSRF